MFSSACCGRFPRRSSTGVRRSTFKLPPAAACSPSLAAVWHVSCILGKVGDGTAAAAAGSGRCIPPSTPNNTTANLYQSHHTPPKTINTETETEPKLGCAVAAGAVRCCGVALGFDSVQTFRAGPLAPSTSCNTRIISRTQCHAHSQNVTFCPGCCPHLTQLAVRSSCARVHLPLRSSHCRRRTPPGT